MGKEGDEYSKENVRCCVEEVICNCEHPNVRDADYSGYPSTIVRVSVVRNRRGVTTHRSPTARIAARDIFVR